MNIQIITSSYPAYPDDPSGTAGLFVRAFALELQKQGHQVILQPVARKQQYTPDAGLTIEPLPWQGGDRELASLNMYSPVNWIIALTFFLKARKKVIAAHAQYRIDRTLCMWAVPSGLLGYAMQKTVNKPYDVWALGSDIWRIKRIPFLGRALLKMVIGHAEHVFADGLGLCRDVAEISGRHCEFLPSSRVLPSPRKGNTNPRDAQQTNLLFVGRYHHNKGPDLLLQAMLRLPRKVMDGVRLKMYGLGPLKPVLLKFVVEHHLENYVMVEDGIGAAPLAEELSQADFLVIPSRLESIPVVFSDALQMGTPVIATPVGDLRQLIPEHDCGILADDCSPQALACALEKACVSHQKEAYADNASKLSLEFMVGAVVQKWLSI